jgi:hypothetical protein
MTELLDTHEATPYQQTILERAGDAAFVGGRQTGKTTLAGHAAYSRAEYGDNVVAIAPRLSMVNNLRRTILESDGTTQTNARTIGVDGSDGSVYLLSAYRCKGPHGAVNIPNRFDYDAIVVDEASHIDADILRHIIGDEQRTLMVGTPQYPDLGQFSAWSRSDGPFTVRATTFDAPFVDTDYVYSMQQDIGPDRALGEIYARYHTDDRGQ